MRDNRRWTFSLEEALLWKCWPAVIVWSENALMQDCFLQACIFWLYKMSIEKERTCGQVWCAILHFTIPSAHTHSSVVNTHTRTHTHTHTHYNPCQYRDLNPWPLGYKSLWWTEVVWIIVMFLSAVWTLIRHPFTTEHPLVRYWCRDTFLQIWWKNKLIYIFDALRVSTFSAKYFCFWWLIPLISKSNS